MQMGAVLRPACRLSTGRSAFELRDGLKLAEVVGNAPTSGLTDSVFGTGAASLYLPAFHDWLPGLDLHQHRAV